MPGHSDDMSPRESSAGDLAVGRTAGSCDRAELLRTKPREADAGPSYGAVTGADGSDLRPDPFTAMTLYSCFSPALVVLSR